MQNYDKAYELAKQMKQSEEYQAYCEAKEKAFAEQLNKDLYKKFLEISRAANAAHMAGQEPSAELVEQCNKLMSVLSLNTDVQDFMLAEHRLNQMIGDIFKILADAVQVDLSFLED